MKDAHWRKPWPEGIIDDSTGDEDVLNLPPEKKKPKDKEKDKDYWAWSYDDDVVDTRNSIKTAEDLIGTMLPLESVHDGGLDLLDKRPRKARVLPAKNSTEGEEPKPKAKKVKEAAAKKASKASEEDEEEPTKASKKADKAKEEGDEEEE